MLSTSSAAEAHSLEVFNAPYVRAAGVHHRPVRIGVSTEALSAAASIHASSRTAAAPPVESLSTSTVTVPPKTVSAAEYRQMKSTHITHKLGTLHLPWGFATY
jgi:hypothetical protein